MLLLLPAQQRKEKNTAVAADDTCNKIVAVINWLDKEQDQLRRWSCSEEYVQAPLLWSPVGRGNVHSHIIAQ